MADNGTAEHDMLRNIQQAIIIGSRCFENGYVDCNIVLRDLRIAQLSLNLVNIGANNKCDIESTISALINQIEMKIANHLASLQENAFSAPRENVTGIR